MGFVWKLGNIWKVWKVEKLWKVWGKFEKVELVPHSLLLHNCWMVLQKLHIFPNKTSQKSFRIHDQTHMNFPSTLRTHRNHERDSFHFRLINKSSSSSFYTANIQTSFEIIFKLIECAREKTFWLERAEKVVTKAHWSSTVEQIFTGENKFCWSKFRCVAYKLNEFLKKFIQDWFSGWRNCKNWGNCRSAVWAICGQIKWANTISHHHKNLKTFSSLLITSRLVLLHLTRRFLLASFFNLPRERQQPWPSLFSKSGGCHISKRVKSWGEHNLLF